MRANRYSTLDADTTLAIDTTPLLTTTISNDIDDRYPSPPPSATKFKQLYFKNEKLRKQLKQLNTRLNQKLQHLKYHCPDPEAQLREMDNAYKQEAVYRKRIQSLKQKEQSAQSIEKIKQLQNDITFKDMEIDHAQQQLKSIRLVTRLQNKTLEGEVQTDEQNNTTDKLRLQIDRLKKKMQQISEHARKADKKYKAQQAYLVVLHTKERTPQEHTQIQEQPQSYISDMEFRIVREQIEKCKAIHQDMARKIDMSRIAIKSLSREKNDVIEKIREGDRTIGNLRLKIQSYHRLLRDMGMKNKALYILQSSDLYLDQQLSSFHPISQQNPSIKHSLHPTPPPTPPPTLPPTLHPTPPPTPPPTKIDIRSMKQGEESEQEEREWQGECRKVSVGYMRPQDTQFQESGQLHGLRVYFTQDHMVCGLVGIMNAAGPARRETHCIGSHGTIELKWEVKEGDTLSKITGSFTEQGYLGEINLVTQKGEIGKFGLAYPDVFVFKLKPNEFVSGYFGGVRRLGSDFRVTEMGFWVSK